MYTPNYEGTEFEEKDACSWGRKSPKDKTGQYIEADKARLGTIGERLVSSGINPAKVCFTD